MNNRKKRWWGNTKTLSIPEVDQFIEIQTQYEHLGARDTVVWERFVGVVNGEPMPTNAKEWDLYMSRPAEELNAAATALTDQANKVLNAISRRHLLNEELN